MTDPLRSRGHSWRERLEAVGRALDASGLRLRDVAVTLAGERVFVTALTARGAVGQSAWVLVTLEVVGGQAVPIAAASEAAQDWDAGELRSLPPTPVPVVEAEPPWEACRIAAERVRSPVLGSDVWRFQAELTGPRGGVVATSRSFKAESFFDGQEWLPDETPDARSAHHALVQRLVADGWEPGAADKGWFGGRFRRPLPRRGGAG